ADGRRPRPPGRLRLRLARHDPAGAALPAGPPGGDGRADRAGRGDAALGPARGRAPAAVPAGPGGPGLRRAAGEPGAAHGPLPLRRWRGADSHARAAARRRADPPEPRGRRGQRAVPGAGSVLRRPVLPGGRARLPVLRADRAGREPAGIRAAAEPAGQPGHGGRRGGGARRRPLHQLRPGLRPRRGVPGPVRGDGRRPGGLAALPGGVPGRRRGQLPAGRAPLHREPDGHHRTDGGPMTTPAPERQPSAAVDGRKVPASSGEGGPSRAEVCVVACAEAWRGDGAILASPMGLIPTLGARLAQLTFSPALLLTDGEAYLVAPGPDGASRVVEGWLPYRSVFTMVAAGLRHVMMGAAQIDRFGNQNISCIGEWARPKAQLLGARGAPGNTVNHPVSYWVPRHARRVSTEQVDMVSGIGHDRAAGLGRQAARFHELRVVVTNLAVLDFQTADGTMRLRSAHPGVTAGDVTAATGFPL